MVEIIQQPDCAPFDGIAVFVRKGVSLQQMNTAPYGPANTIAHGPIPGGGPGPAAALVANWPPAALEHLLGRQALVQQMQHFFVASIFFAKPGLSEFHESSTEKKTIFRA